MLCPFCQYELNIEQASCANCGAAMPRSGVAFGVKLRTLCVGCAGLFLASVMLSDCVLSYLPGGVHSGYSAPVSSQQSHGPPPNMKSPQLQAQMQDWLHGSQSSQNPAPALHSRHGH